MAYATPADVYDLALPAAALAARPKTVEGANISTGVLRLTGHGLSLGSLLQFSLEGQAAFGATANALPGGLATDANYTAAPLAGSNLFRVRPEGGAIIGSFSSAPVGPFAIIVDPIAALVSSLEKWSWVINDAIIDSKGPFLVDPSTGAYHPKLTISNAVLVGRASMLSLGTANPQYRADVDAYINGPLCKLVDGWLEEWKRGVPLYPEQPDQTPGSYENAARATYDKSPANWESGTL